MLPFHQNLSPVYEGTLGVHEVKLVVESRPSLRDGRRVAQHANAPGDNNAAREEKSSALTLGPWQDRLLARPLAAGS